MSAGEDNHTVSTSCANMESINRISQLPVVKSTVETATTLYSKVKDYNSMTQWTFSTAENAVNKAVEITKPYAAPVVSHLEGPIKKVDDVLCNSLDYVEKKVPAVKLPTDEIYAGAKDLVNNTVGPAVQTAKTIYEPTLKNYVEPAVETAKQYVEPAVQGAKNIVEPAVQSAKNIVEPLVQPVVDKANALKEYGAEKLDEFLHPGNEDELECEECAGNKNNGDQQPQY